MLLRDSTAPLAVWRCASEGERATRRAINNASSQLMSNYTGLNAHPIDGNLLLLQTRSLIFQMAGDN